MAGRVATVTGVRVAIVTESFLPQVNGVTNSVLRVVEHLRERGHQALIIAPGVGPDRYLHARVCRVKAVDLPVITSLPIGVPGPKVYATLAGLRPDVVHLASPFVLGAGGLRAARWLGVATVAVYQTDIRGFAARDVLPGGAGDGLRATGDRAQRRQRLPGGVRRITLPAPCTDAKTGAGPSYHCRSTP